jgi:threonylcarbamoyladenosine tRNA methylthiotransferase MtaB
VTGCSAALEASSLAGLSPHVVIVPQERKDALLGLADVLRAAADPLERARALRGDDGRPADPFAYDVDSPSFRTRAFLKIQDGCDCSCSYCRVPLARGAAVSLGAEEVIRRARAVQDRGTGEIVLTGVNVSAWRGDDGGLAVLLRRLLSEVPGPRYRVSSLEPDALSEELCAALGAPGICPHFHLPVQSGSDPVLRAMKRRYTAGKVIEGVQRLRALGGDPFIAADLIAGYPGETPEDFARTAALARDAGFAALHVFPFSARPGTAAEHLLPRVPERVRTERVAELSRLSAELASAYAARWAGREVEVLLERRGARGVLGTSANYLRVETTGVPPGERFSGRRARVVLGASVPAISGRFVSFTA